MTIEVSTVADDLVVLHDGANPHRFDGLEPDTTYELLGTEVRTLPRPPGELLSVVVTVNDVHFGEFECGVLEEFPGGPILRAADGADPYPEMMNRAAVAEMAALGPGAVVVKGDLTLDGAPDEYDAFLACYEPAFGDRLVHVRGNHDAYHGQSYAAGPQVRDMAGARLAVLDTVQPTSTYGRVSTEQLDWLDEVAAGSDRPVLVFGHHHPWAPGSRNRSDTYFGIHPDDSERLIDLVARQPRIVGYFAGHTHRNRVRRFAVTGDVPWVEVACVKDFPGSWAEYRVFEGGILQVHHRISSPEALAWSEQCRSLYSHAIDYVAYAMGGLGDRSFPIWPRPLSGSLA